MFRQGMLFRTGLVVATRRRDKRDRRLFGGWLGGNTYLLQDKEHVLLTGKRSQQDAIRERLEFLRRDLQTLEKFAVLTESIPDLTFCLRQPNIIVDLRI
jgi:hypothetical protein